MLYLAEDCRQAFDDFDVMMTNHARLKGPGLKGWVAKGPGTVLRLALVWELMRWAGTMNASEPVEVSREAFEAARQLWEGCLLEHAERVFGFEKRTDGDEHARKLALYLAETGEKTVNASVIRERRMPGLKRAESVHAAFDRLVDASIVFPNPKRDGGTDSGRGSVGRARLDYVVNPRLEPIVAKIGNPEPD